VGCKGKGKTDYLGLKAFNFFLAISFQIIGLILALNDATSNLSYSKNSIIDSPPPPNRSRQSTFPALNQRNPFFANKF
jgi:hypothetical protein